MTIPRKPGLLPGARVRVNDSFPYEGRGREGTIISKPPASYRHGWVRVQFDAAGGVVDWHQDYFDLVEGFGACSAEQAKPAPSDLAGDGRTSSEDTLPRDTSGSKI